MLVLSIEAINDLPLVVTVVVGTSGARVGRDYPSNVRVDPVDSGLLEQTVFLCFQLRSLAHERFPPRRAGLLAPAKLAEVEQAVRRCLGL